MGDFLFRCRVGKDFLMMFQIPEATKENTDKLDCTEVKKKTLPDTNHHKLNPQTNDFLEENIHIIPQTKGKPP